jgi:hypothetical protein
MGASDNPFMDQGLVAKAQSLDKKVWPLSSEYTVRDETVA